ncbi:MAG: DUF92 domain-containing protein [Chloroflexi bacterium]|nr:DUF92 domain-containing protein [Chloroflexota bacterium]
MQSLPIARLLLGLILSIPISYFAYRAGSLSASGILGAVLVGTATFGYGGWSWGLLLIGFFATSSALSQYRAREKEPLAEKFAKGGKRDLAQTIANGGVGAALAVLNFYFPSQFWIAAFWGSIATASADTWGTELGVLSSRRPRLITTGRQVAVGTSGAVSGLGLLASLGGALAMAVFEIFLFWSLGPQITLGMGSAAIISGFAGSLIDSLLGATVQVVYWCPLDEVETERFPTHNCGTPTIYYRGWKWLNNDGVNFLATLCGSIVAGGLWTFLG